MVASDTEVSSRGAESPAERAAPADKPLPTGTEEQPQDSGPTAADIRRMNATDFQNAKHLLGEAMQKLDRAKRSYPGTWYQQASDAIMSAVRIIDEQREVAKVVEVANSKRGLAYGPRA